MVREPPWPRRRERDGVPFAPAISPIQSIAVQWWFAPEWRASAPPCRTRTLSAWSSGRAATARARRSGDASCPCGVVGTGLDLVDPAPVAPVARNGRGHAPPPEKTATRPKKRKQRLPTAQTNTLPFPRAACQVDPVIASSTMAAQPPLPTVRPGRRPAGQCPGRRLAVAPGDLRLALVGQRQAQLEAGASGRRPGLAEDQIAAEAASQLARNVQAQAGAF